MRKTERKSRISFAVLTGAACALASLTMLAASPVQKTFSTADDAWKGLLHAATQKDASALKAIFGPDSEDLITSGDPVADQGALDTFLAAAKEKTALVKGGDDKVIVVIGNKEWPYPIPIVKAGGAWHFDTAVGKEEVINRRIGKNELCTLQVCRAYVNAQEEYGKLHKEHHYAQKLLSDEGSHDGLYWPVNPGDPESPLGPLVARAVKGGYGKSGPFRGEPIPFNGYYFKILNAQGKNAPGGAQSYLKGGNMTGGFALAAWPANYGASGVTTFIVGRQGVVFQKDLGPQTEEAVKAMTAYDPDNTWEPVKD